MTEFSIENKVAIVTGGAKGIGLAIVEDLIINGAKSVIVIDINAEQGIQATTVLNSKYGVDKAFFLKADVTEDLDEVFEIVLEKYKYIDILVNNAGIVDEHNIRRTLSINTIATVEWSLKFLETARKDKNGKGGTILNISSIYGFVIDPYLMFYKTSKFAVIGFSTSIGHVANYETTGVRVLVLCPGFTRTELCDNFTHNDALKFQKGEIWGDRPWQEKEDVARAAVEVIKKAETGSIWTIEGGQDVTPLLVPQHTD